jgi:methanogenic corrinoid protein MtbC1
MDRSPMAGTLLTQYLNPLLQGRRQVCRELVKDALDTGVEPRSLYQSLIWPAMEHVDRLYRDDRINLASEHMATRINRTIADHLQTRLDRRPSNEKTVLITSASGEAEEISAQMCADLFEADGWEVFLLGGGVPQDEIIALVGQLQPDVLMIFGSKPTDAPLVRCLIDEVRQINSCPSMNIMVSGGVFNRAAGLWKEVKADLYAETASDALALAAGAEPRQPEVRVPGAPKKRRRRRKPPLLSEVEVVN